MINLRSKIRKGVRSINNNHRLKSLKVMIVSQKRKRRRVKRIRNRVG